MSASAKREHVWGKPDAAGARACDGSGCTVRVLDSFRRFQTKKGSTWINLAHAPLPACKGVEVPVVPAPQPEKMTDEEVKDLFFDELTLGQFDAARAELHRARREEKELAAELERLRADRRPTAAQALKEQMRKAQAELARLTPSGKVAEDEAKVDEWLRRGDMFSWAPVWVRAAVSRLAAKAQGYEAAVADNAALLSLARDWLNEMEVDQECSCHPGDPCPWHRVKEIVAAPHPGAALLAEHEKAADALDQITGNLGGKRAAMLVRSLKEPES